MAAYRQVYDSRHLQADCQEPASAPGTYARLPLPFFIVVTAAHNLRTVPSALGDAAITGIRVLLRCSSVNVVTLRAEECS